MESGLERARLAIILCSNHSLVPRLSSPISPFNLLLFYNNVHPLVFLSSSQLSEEGETSSITCSVQEEVHMPEVTYPSVVGGIIMILEMSCPRVMMPALWVGGVEV